MRRKRQRKRKTEKQKNRKIRTWKRRKRKRSKNTTLPPASLIISYGTNKPLGRGGIMIRKWKGKKRRKKDYSTNHLPRTSPLNNMLTITYRICRCGGSMARSSRLQISWDSFENQIGIINFRMGNNSLPTNIIKEYGLLQDSYYQLRPYLVISRTRMLFRAMVLPINTK